MANVIPIVSSSPPPLDDAGSSFNATWDKEDEEEDFGGFEAAPPSEPVTVIANDDKDEETSCIKHEDWSDFGDFNSQPAPEKAADADPVPVSDTHSQESISDSGLSSDISPKEEEFDSKSGDLDFNELQWDSAQPKSATLTSSDSGQVMVTSKEGMDEGDVNYLVFRPPSFSEDDVPPQASCEVAADCDDVEKGDEDDWLNAAMEDTAEEDQHSEEEEDEESTFKATTNCDSNNSTSQSQQKDAQDEFADFEAFHSSSPAESDHSNVEVESEWSAFGAGGSTEETEGWAAFAGGATVDDNVNNSELNAESSVHSADDDDFGDFGGAASEVHVDDDFADDFDDFESAVAPQPSPSQVQPTFDPEQLDNRINAILSRCFESENDSGTDEPLNVHILSQLIEIAQEREERVEQPSPAPGLRSFPSHKGPQSVNKYDANVWNNLKSTETTPALKYHWADSCMQAQLLTALGIDTRNILMGHKKQSAPVFAASLCMLEPTRGDTDANGRLSELMVDTNASPSLQTQDIPMPDFDWGSSGLTNPLDGSSTVPLDLDFFVTNRPGSASLAKSAALQKEKEILQAIEPTKSQPPKSLQPLENLLATMNFTPTTPASKVKENEELSSKGREVILGLPNLSFMHAKVLMFRLGSTSE